MRYYCDQALGSHTVDELKAVALFLKKPIKFYDEHGFLKGTVYPNGEVQR